MGVGRDAAAALAPLPSSQGLGGGNPHENSSQAFSSSPLGARAGSGSGSGRGGAAHPWLESPSLPFSSPPPAALPFTSAAHRQAPLSSPLSATPAQAQGGTSFSISNPLLSQRERAPSSSTSASFSPPFAFSPTLALAAAAAAARGGAQQQQQQQQQQQLPQSALFNNILNPPAPPSHWPLSSLHKQQQHQQQGSDGFSAENPMFRR